MADVKLIAIPANHIAIAQPVMKMADGATLTGEGETNYLCAGCGRVLAENMRDTQIPPALVLQCLRCNTFNRR